MADQKASSASPASGIASGLGGILGGILGSNASSAAQGEANNDANISNQILQEIQNAPDISKPLILQKYAQAGVLTPAMQANITAQLPANITTDPKFKQAQMQALQQMSQRANTGFTQGDRAALNQAQLQAQGDTKSRLASIQQNMQQQGLSDSGSKLAAQLSAAQNESNQMSNNADQQAQISQQAREQALSNLGQYGSQLQGQDFNQQLAQQQAQQQMQRFNIQNQLGVQSANVGAQNQAQAANLANAQNVSNQNTNSQNQELNNQLQRQMQQYNSDVNTAQIKAGGYAGMSGYNSGLAKNQNQAGYNTGAGIGQLAGAATMLNQGGPVHNYKGGGQVQALNAHEKAVVPGDSPENDKVHAILSAGEIVIPRTLSESKFGKHILKIIEAHNTLKKHMNGEDSNG